ncbi:MAG TPA: Ig-like domain-containing protein [Gemmatimonas sp.]|uniref:Ig-like domain-containing protein n=1 Tax=Gemmatimonas sp. TaxID=1962908 RepID=UPI002ED9C780
MSLSPQSLCTQSHNSSSRHGARKRRAVLTLLSLAGVIGAAACGGTDAVDTTTPVPTTIVAVAATDSQRAAVTTTLPSPIAVRVRDQNGNALPAAAVAWTVLSGGGAVSLGVSATDANGEAATVWTLGRTASTQTVTATLISGVSDTIVAIGTAGPAAAFALVDGDNQTLAVGQTSAPLRVRVLDQYGNVVPSLAVSWTTTGGTLSAAQSTTNATGIASITLQVASGPQVVTARIANGATLTFNLRGQP